MAFWCEGRWEFWVLFVLCVYALAHQAIIALRVDLLKKALLLILFCVTAQPDP